MNKKTLIIIFVILFLTSACTNNPTISPIDPIKSDNQPATERPNIPLNIQALRATYFEFAIENRLDYVPVFDEGKAPSSSTEYLFYAFAINLENWGDDKGTMTRDYVEKVIRNHFEVKNITHAPLRKGWNYDGEKYTAVPQGIKEKPIYVLKEYNTHIQNGRTVYEVTLDNCSFGGKIPTEEDMANIRANIISGDFSALTVIRTESFNYYLNQTTGDVVFV